MSLVPSCIFWDGHECHYEPLVPGCQPCAECPPEPFWPFFTMTLAGLMIADVILNAQGFVNVLFFIDWNYHASRFTD